MPQQLALRQFIEVIWWPFSQLPLVLCGAELLLEVEEEDVVEDDDVDAELELPPLFFSFDRLKYFMMPFLPLPP